MPKGLQRFHHTGDWHFITCSCYRRQKFLDSKRRRGLFLDILEQVRARYDFVVVGYVVMPEHFHLLIGEPRMKKLFTAMQVLKQRVSVQCRGKKRKSASQKSASQMWLWQEAIPPALWQPRYDGFNVFTQRKYVEKLRYIHRNPVKRGLVPSPELWRWSSYRDYFVGENGKVKIGN
ncbi:MAG: transposase [Candidatus Angelobacter sp.]